MSQSHLLKTRRFFPLFCTQFLGAFNDNVLKNALVILITFQSASILGVPPEGMVAACGGIFILPFFLFSATAGQLADKYEKGMLIRWIKIVEIAIMVLATLGFVFHQVPFLLLVLFLMGLHSTFFGPIKYSILPQLLREDELVGGNALIETGTFLAILLGTIGGGLLIAQQPYGPTLVSAFLLGVAVLGWVTSLSIPKCPPAAPDLTVQWNPVPPTLEIYGSLRKNRVLFLSVLGISWFWFFGGAFLSLLPHYGKDVLHTGQGGVTAFLAIFSVGIGIGSMLCERFSGKKLELGLVPLGSIGITVFAFDLFLVGSPAGAPTTFQWARIVFDLLGLSIFSGFYIVPLYTLIQERSDPRQRSRVIAANNIINALFMVTSAGMLMLTSGRLTIPENFLLLAALNAVVAIYIYTLLPEFLLRFMVYVLANIIYKLRVKGHHKIPDLGPVVLVCNHVTFVDWLIVASAVRRPTRFVMDHSFVKGPITGFLFRQAKVIPIASAKENPEILAAAVAKIAQELRDGEVVCIFPEGKITRDGKMNEFRPGIEKIIAETPAPVVPMALRGLWTSFFARNPDARKLSAFPWLLRKPVTLVIDLAIPPEQVTAASLQQKVAELRGDRL